jgi:hypothetical protein
MTDHRTQLLADAERDLAYARHEAEKVLRTNTDPDIRQDAHLLIKDAERQRLHVIKNIISSST